jgi:hypothetical protein
MTSSMKTAASISALVILSLIIAACDDSFSDDAIQNDDGNVTITVDWNGPDDGFVFNIAMDTHSVDLDGYDLSELAVLILDGELEVRPRGWDAPSGGHHRKGTLRFPDVSVDGTPIEVSRVRSVQLIVKDVAGVPERSFTWNP